MSGRPDDLRLAIASLRKAHPGLAAAVVKLDNSVSGDGNQVIALQDPTGSPASARTICRARGLDAGLVPG